MDGPAVPMSSFNLIRNPLRIGTWNVLSLNPNGHSELLARELSRLNVAIAGLQEVRWTGSGETSTDSYKLIWSGHESHRIQGVALAVHRKYVGSLTFWKPLGPRLMHARFKHSFGFISLFVCYAPTEAADQEAKDTFYQKLNSELGLSPAMTSRWF